MWNKHSESILEKSLTSSSLWQHSKSLTLSVLFSHLVYHLNETHLIDIVVPSKAKRCHSTDLANAISLLCVFYCGVCSVNVQGDILTRWTSSSARNYSILECRGTGNCCKQSAVPFNVPRMRRLKKTSLDIKHEHLLTYSLKDVLHELLFN